MEMQYAIDLFLSRKPGFATDAAWVLGDKVGHEFHGNQFMPGGEEHADKVGHQHKVGDRVHIVPIQENGTINRVGKDSRGEPLITVTRDSDKQDHLARTFELGPEKGAIDTGIAGPHGGGVKGAIDPGGIAGTPSHDSPIYREQQKMPKYNGTVSPLNAGYNTAGQMLRQRMPGTSKEEHLAHGDMHFARAKEMERQHTALVDKTVKKMGGNPKLPTALQQDKFGPLISGVISEKFPDKVKNKLRDLAHGATASKYAGLAHYAAGGKRHETAVAKLHQN